MTFFILWNTCACTIIDLLCYSNIAVDVWSIGPSYRISKWYLLLVLNRDKDDKSGHELIGFLWAFNYCLQAVCCVPLLLSLSLQQTWSTCSDCSVSPTALGCCWESHQAYCGMVSQPHSLFQFNCVFLFLHFSFYLLHSLYLFCCICGNCEYVHWLIPKFCGYCVVSGGMYICMCVCLLVVWL